MEKDAGVSINGTFIGKTDDSGELKVQDAAAGVDNEISLKRGSGQIITTNIMISEADVRVVVFNIARAEPGTGIPVVPAQNRLFSIGLSVSLRSPDNGGQNNEFFSDIDNIANGYGATVSSPYEHLFSFGIEANFLFRLNKFIAVGPFLNAEYINFYNTAGNNFDLSVLNYGALLRIIPFSFTNGNSESIIYIDLKAGMGNILNAGLNTTSDTNTSSGSSTTSITSGSSSYYFSAALGGLWGVTPSFQIGLAAGMEYGSFENLSYYYHSSSTTGNLGSSTVLINSGYFLQLTANFLL
jgi:hypothetical protein